MITPNKFISFDRSVLSKLPAVLEAIQKSDDLRSLYENTSSHFDSVADFLIAIDVLHILNRVDLEPTTGRLLHVV